VQLNRIAKRRLEIRRQALIVPDLRAEGDPERRAAPDGRGAPPTVGGRISSNRTGPEE
jgi:hypothetical protein